MEKKDWLGFRTKTELEAAIRGELDSKAKTADGKWDFGKEFASDLLSRVFGERHYGCLHHGVTPEMFRVCFNQEYKTSYKMNAKIPSFGWKAVSWVNAVNRRTIDDSLKTSFRAVFESVTQEFRRKPQRCQGCGSVDFCDIHHVNPTFAAIAQLALSMVTPEDKTYFLDHCFDGDSEEIRLNLMDHPAAILVRDIHFSEGCVTAILCKSCHKKQHGAKAKH